MGATWSFIPSISSKWFPSSVEHFRLYLMYELGGRAKAMVVTGSRLAAVKYKLAFDRYIDDQGYTGIRSLVAFSGTVDDPDDPGSSYTEVAMNDGLAESELPETFERGRLPGSSGRGEVPDGLRSALAADHVRGEAPSRCSGGSDPLKAQPHRARQVAHLRPRFRERGR